MRLQREEENIDPQSNSQPVPVVLEDVHCDTEDNASVPADVVQEQDLRITAESESQLVEEPSQVREGKATREMTQKSTKKAADKKKKKGTVPSKSSGGSQKRKGSGQPQQNGVSTQSKLQKTDAQDRNLDEVDSQVLSAVSNQCA